MSPIWAEEGKNMVLAEVTALWYHNGQESQIQVLTRLGQGTCMSEVHQRKSKPSLKVYDLVEILLYFALRKRTMPCSDKKAATIGCIIWRQ